MEITGATYMKDRFVESLSHGMKQRVGITRTLIHDPAVIFLDEPANGLDPRARIDMRELLLRLAKMGKTLFVTSHILPELARICDKLVIISQGQLKAQGTLDQIMSCMGQHRIIEIEVTQSAHVAKLEAMLKADPNLGSDVRSSPQEAMVRFSTAIDDQALAGILAKLIGARHPRFSVPGSADGS